MKLKRKTANKPTIVYKIIVGDVVRYWGITNDLKRRQTQHNKGLSSGLKKTLYVELLKEGVTSVDLIPVFEFKSRVEAKRRECLMILEDWFGPRLLFQKVPNISDR